MAKFYVNFVITVEVDNDNITAEDIDSPLAGEDIQDSLTDEQWNAIVSEALDVMEIGGQNVDSIEYIGEEDE